MEGIEQLLPSFSGVKFSGVDLMDFGRCVHHSKDSWALLYGVDEVSIIPVNIILQWCHLDLVVCHKSLKQTFFSISFYKATACSSRFGSRRRCRKVSRLNIYSGGSLFVHSVILTIIVWQFYAHSTYNYIGRHFNQLISAFNEGNLTQARKIQVTICYCFLFVFFT